MCADAVHPGDDSKFKTYFAEDGIEVVFAAESTEGEKLAGPTATSTPDLDLRIEDGDRELLLVSLDRDESHANRG